MRKINIFVLLFFCLFSFGTIKNKKFCFAQNSMEFTYKIDFQGKEFYYKDIDFRKNLSKTRQKYYHDKDIIENLEDLNFSREEIINYLYPEVKEIFERLQKKIEKKQTDDAVIVKVNKCELSYIDGCPGKTIDKVDFYEQVYKQIKTQKSQNLQIKIKLIEYKDGKTVRELFKEKSCFSTNFSSSSFERKNNIKVALESLDGLVIEEGEILFDTQTEPSTFGNEDNVQWGEQTDDGVWGTQDFNASQSLNASAEW